MKLKFTSRCVPINESIMIEATTCQQCQGRNFVWDPEQDDWKLTSCNYCQNTLKETIPVSELMQ
jgi:heterodisulfide reductase subunit B